MPDYISYDEMKAALPADIMAQLLDDQGSGAPDMDKWEKILAAVKREIDGSLEQKYALPLATVPNSIGDAAFKLTAELLYSGRGFHGDANPWTEKARDVRKTLQKFADGSVQLLPSAVKTNAPAVLISEPAKTTPSTGNMLV